MRGRCVGCVREKGWCGGRWGGGKREGVGRLAEEVCGGGQAALAAGVSCLEAVSAVVRAVGYEGDVGVALDEAGRWEVDRPHHQEGR